MGKNHCCMGSSGKPKSYLLLIGGFSEIDSIDSWNSAKNGVEHNNFYMLLISNL